VGIYRCYHEGDVSVIKNFTRIPLLLLLVAFGCVAGVLLSQLLPRDLLSIIGGGGTVNTQATLILDRVQSLSQLTTTRYNYSLLVTSSREMPPILAGLYGESLSLIAVGHVNAGIDLSLLEAKDIVEQDGRLVITLPPPTLQDCFFNEQQSSIVQRDTGIFAQPSTTLDNAARRYAIEQLRDAALADGILAEAQTQAALVITELVTAIGVEQVQVNTAPPDPNAPPPATCG
jgi:hypothetical protein